MAAGLLVACAASAGVMSPRRLLELVDIGNPVLSPDGRRVAFRTEVPSIERNTVDTVWYVQAVDGASPPGRIADGGAPLRELVNGLVLPSPAVWSPDGRWLYYRARIDDRVAVWRAATDGSGARTVTNDAADVRSFVLTDQGKTLKYSVGATREAVLAAEQAEYDSGVHIDSTVNVSAGLFRSTNANGRAETQRFTNDWFAAGPLLSNAPDRWKAVDLIGMQVRDLAGVEVPPPELVPGDFSRLYATPDRVAVNSEDKRIALLISGAKRPGQLASLTKELAMLPDRHAKKPVRCTDPLCAGKYITDLLWRPGSNELLFSATDFKRGRAQAIYAWDVTTNVVREVVVSDGLLSGSQRYWDIPCALSEELLVCVAAEASRPPRLEAIKLSNGQRRALYEPNKGLELDIAGVAPAELLRWQDEQGREFTGQFFPARKVSAGPPAPLFVTYYSCHGFLRGGLGDEWPLASLAESGIASLCINGLAGYASDFVERHDPGRSAVESAVALLAQSGRIDPTRVGMGGLSFGTEVTMWTLANSDIIKAASVASLSATPNYRLFYSLNSGLAATLLESWQVGALEETLQQWQRVSPVYHLDRIRAPILFQQAEQEYRLSLDYALPLVRRNQADMYVFPDELHIKFQPRHKLAVYERNLDWFRFWLQGYEDPDLRKAGRYQRWREMRAAKDEWLSSTARSDLR